MQPPAAWPVLAGNMHAHLQKAQSAYHLRGLSGGWLVRSLRLGSLDGDGPGTRHDFRHNAVELPLHPYVLADPRADREWRAASRQDSPQLPRPWLSLLAPCYAVRRKGRCGSRTRRHCGGTGGINAARALREKRLGVGTRITVQIVKPSWIGEEYTFTMRAGQRPRIQVGCLEPGARSPSLAC